MITVHIFPPGLGEPSLSPFCVKTMAQMIMAKQDWQAETHRGTPELAPYGKLPAIETEDQIIGDSAVIQGWLEARADLWPGIPPQARVLGHALIRMTEENLRLGLVHDRWLDPACWPAMRDAIFRGARDEIVAEKAPMVQEHTRKAMMSNSIARFSPADRLARMVPDLDALVGALGDKPWLLGDQPCAADAAIAPIIRALATLPGETALGHETQKRPSLTGWAHRFAESLYPKMPEAQP